MWIKFFSSNIKESGSGGLVWEVLSLKWTWIVFNEK